MKKQLLSLALTLTMVISLFSGLTITASAEGDTHVNHNICGYTSCEGGWCGNNIYAPIKEHSPEALEWTAWTESDSLPESGNYYLDTDVTLEGRWTITGDVALCLNGKVFNIGDCDIYVENNGTLTLSDCNSIYRPATPTEDEPAEYEPAEYTFDADENGLWILNEDGTGDESVEGGIITGGGNSAINVSGGGEFVMYGGNLVGNTASSGGGIKVQGGDVTIWGGTICGNYAEYCGGGISPYSATVNLFGGSITDNVCGLAGGGISVDSSELNVKKAPVVKGNKRGSDENNVEIVAEMASDLEPASGNLPVINVVGILWEAEIGVTIGNYDFFTRGYSEKNGKSDPAAVFFSDDPNYGVSIDCVDGEYDMDDEDEVLEVRLGERRADLSSWVKMGEGTLTIEPDSEDQVFYMFYFGHSVDEEHTERFEMYKEYEKRAVPTIVDVSVHSSSDTSPVMMTIFTDGETMPGSPREKHTGTYQMDRVTEGGYYGIATIDPDIYYEFTGNTGEFDGKVIRRCAINGLYVFEFRSVNELSNPETLNAVVERNKTFGAIQNGQPLPDLDEVNLYYDYYAILRDDESDNIPNSMSLKWVYKDKTGGDYTDAEPNHTADTDTYAYGLEVTVTSLDKPFNENLRRPSFKNSSNEYGASEYITEVVTATGPSYVVVLSEAARLIDISDSVTVVSDENGGYKVNGLPQNCSYYFMADYTSDIEDEVMYYRYALAAQPLPGAYISTLPPIPSNCTLPANALAGNNLFIVFVMNGGTPIAFAVEDISDVVGSAPVPPPHEHNYTNSYIPNNDGTHKGVCACEAVSGSSEACDTAGENGACSKCGYKASEEEPEPPHEHNYTNSYISNNDGTHKGVCACEAVSDSSEDCDTAGEDGACSKCGYTAPSDEPVTPPHEHNYTDSYVSDNGGNHKGVCACDAVSGTSEPCDTANNGACSKCGYTAPGEEPEEETFSVTITVKEEISSGTYGSCVNADVLLIGANGEELMYGTHIEDGKYVFTNVPSGIYNIEVSKNMGEPGVKVKTVLITVDSNIVLDEEIKLSQANINSKLDVTVETTDNSPIKGANVGGLDNLADMVAAQVKAEPANSGATVDIDVAMKIDTKMSENVPVEEKAPIETAAREQSSNLAFLDINITKTITVNSVARNPERIHDTGSLLEVVIPFDTDGKENFAVYRYHTESGGFTDRVQMLTSTPNRAGEYIDTRTSGIIKMYVQYFSTYAIGFDNVTSGGGIVGGSGGSDSSAYTITIAKTENGEVTVSSKSPAAGSKVTVTAKPKAGYELDQLTVTDKNGKEIKVTDLGNGTYSFKMPSGNVTVKATFHVKFGTCPKDATCPIHPYTDASTTAWYHDGVHYCINHGIMNGYGNGIFKPNGTVTRQQIWLTLARISGENPANAAEARVWAMENGVSDGTNPTQAVTRQQFITMLYRYAVSEGYDVSVGEDTNILSYTDAFDVAEYAIPAVQWSCGSGVMGGYTDGTLKPTATTTRAHLATFLQRFCVEIAK